MNHILEKYTLDFPMLDTQKIIQSTYEATENEYVYRTLKDLFSTHAIESMLAGWTRDLIHNASDAQHAYLRKEVREEKMLEKELPADPYKEHDPEKVKQIRAEIRSLAEGRWPVFLNDTYNTVLSMQEERDPRLPDLLKSLREGIDRRQKEGNLEREIAQLQHRLKWMQEKHTKGEAAPEKANARPGHHCKHC